MSENTSMWYWGFALPAEVHERAQSTVTRLLNHEFGSDANAEAAQVVSELVLAGLDSYYTIPTQMVPLSPRLKKAADGSIQAVYKGIRMVINQFFKQRSASELKELARYLDAMLHESPSNQTAHLVFPIDEAVYMKARSLIHAVQNEPRPRDHLDDVINTLSHMVTEGISHYYERPANLVRLGGLTRKTVDMTMKGVGKGIRSLIDHLVRQLSDDQMRELSYHVASLLHEKRTAASAAT